jgi:hypothetical protein
VAVWFEAFGESIRRDAEDGITVVEVSLGK